MFKILTLAFSTQIVLALAGFSLLQMASPKKQISFFSFLPYGWCIGVLFLYLAGGTLIPLPVLKNKWHLMVLLIALWLCWIGYQVRKRAEYSKSPPSGKPNFGWFEWILVVLIFIKIFVVFYIQMTNPMIDSDAAQPFLWIGLAKVIRYNGYLPAGTPHSFYVFPSFLPAWLSMFLPRWHDSFISLPWFFCYLSMIGIGAHSCYRITSNRAASLLCAYLFSSVPLVIAHVIRPGYSDLILSHFFLLGVAALGILFFGNLEKEESQLWTFILGVAGLGCFLTKHEGVIWFFWMALVWFFYYLRFKRNIRWNKILGGFFSIGFLTAVLYFLLARFVKTSVPMDPRFEQIFDLQFDVRTVRAFGWAALQAGSFHFLWWLMGFMMLWIWVRKTSVEAKVFAWLTAMPFLFVFYLACFTSNIQYTLIQTNISRVLLQIIGLFLPLYAICVKEFTR